MFETNQKKIALKYLLVELNLLFNCINIKRDKVSFLQKNLTISPAIIRSIELSGEIMTEQNLQDGNKLYQITLLDISTIMILDIRVGDIVSITSEFNLDYQQIVDIHYEKRCSNIKESIIIPKILAKKLNYYFNIFNIKNVLSTELENLIKLGFIRNIFDLYKILDIFLTVIKEQPQTRNKWTQILKKKSIEDIYQIRTTEFQKQWIRNLFLAKNISS
uniref:Uncharacterized protein n=1 Tax=Chlorodesmis fastigiata TaxID=189431 RepID=A0A2P0QHE1_CHLFS|nr:hypothetical protein [Chlorodesmis fastigiata]ARO74191.1 hypothetical protein [Chlorodesmis fastigiata]